MFHCTLLFVKISRHVCGSLFVYINQKNSSPQIVHIVKWIQVRPLGLLNEYVLSNIEITESDNGERYKFHFLGSNLIVLVQVVNNMLNLLISPPPTFWNQTTGLMGFYNGNATDDFQASGKIFTISKRAIARRSQDRTRK